MTFPRISVMALLIIMIFMLPLKYANGQQNSVITTIPVAGSPDGIIADSNNGNLFVTDGSTGSTKVISGSTNSVTATIQIGSFSGGGAFNPIKGEVYVANWLAGTVSVIN